MKHVFLRGSISVIALASVIATGCSTSTSTALTDISQLPKATTPVSGTGSAIVARNLDHLGRQATTGLNLYSATKADFTTGKSRGMCEILNMSKEIMDRAAQTDKVLCYVQQVIKANAAALTTAKVDIYDGTAHTMSLDFGGGNTGKVKMKVAKTAGSISEFEMHGCMQSPSSQSEYQHQVIANNTVTMVSKNIGGQGGQTWKGQVDVTGTLDSNLKFASKQMVGQSYNANSDYTGSSKITMNQFADRMAFAGFQTGSWSNLCGGNACSGTNSTRVYSIYELIDTNEANATSYSLHKLAMGDGNLHAILGNTFINNGVTQTPYSQDVSEAWKGDDRSSQASAASGPYQSAVAAGTVPAVEAVSIAFSGAEVWDCSGTAEVTLNVDQAALNTACSDYGLRVDSNDNWINCWEATGN